MRRSLPELPDQRLTRFVAEHGLTEYEAGMLLQNRAFADYFEAVAQASGSGKAAANWMLGEVSRALNERGGDLQRLALSPVRLAELIGLVQAGTINLNTAKETVFPALLAGPGSAGEIVARQGLAQVSDPDAIDALVLATLAAHPGQLAQFRAGKESLLGFFVGQVMKAGKGRLNAQRINEALAKALAAEGETP